MQPLQPEKAPDRGGRSDGAAMLELTVNNHPGVMSHVCGLFSRRACNLEGVLCLPGGDGTSRIWLLVAPAYDASRLENILRQVEKLEDVRAVRLAGPGLEDLAALGELFGGGV